MTVQPGLCRTGSEPKLLVFSRTGSNLRPCLFSFNFSQSMGGDKFDIAKGVAKTVINTLTKQDYVNVICARASYWDEVGK